MTGTYKFLGYAIAVLVVVQAGAIAWAFFGLTDWITNSNGVIDKAYLECEDCESIGAAEWGFAIHMFFNGLVLIPLLSLVLLLVSFFAKVDGGVRLALTIVLLVVLQIIVLPMLSREVDPAFGALHGINALILLGAAIAAGRRASVTSSTTRRAPEPLSA
jgi:uncharacterized membrane protein